MSSTVQGPLKYYSVISQQGAFFRTLRNFNVTVDNPEQPKNGGLPTRPAPSARIDDEASMFEWEAIPNYQDAEEGDLTWTLKACDQAGLDKAESLIKQAIKHTAHCSLEPSRAPMSLTSAMKLVLILPQNIINAIVSVRRLSDFLAAAELQPDACRLIEKPDPQIGDEVLSIKDGNFSWAKTTVEPTLEGVNLSVKKGLVGILDHVGTGKTSSLSAIIGEIGKMDRKVTVTGTVAYAPQNPRILSEIIRDDVLFSHEYDETLYSLVIEGAMCSGFGSRALAKGDMTEVGEKGSALSGGQRDRGALARAIYAPADLILLDACLAAVDSHVARHMFSMIVKQQLSLVLLSILDSLIDPNLSLDEVGVPKTIAMNLTFPERVTPYNISYLEELVHNGPTAHPGECIDLQYDKRADAFLQYGWIVERHLNDGDYILFNRQPSLHKMSLMSHRVKLMPYSLFDLPPEFLSVKHLHTMPIFDDNEMNMHIPQSEETRAELAQIAWVPCQIISPQANKPVMGIVQDTLCGIRRFTLRDTFLDWNAMWSILLWVLDWDGIVPILAILKPKPLWTGKQILSLVIPCGVNIHRSPDPKSSTPVFDDGILIENGDLIFGIVEKKTIGALQGSLIHVVFREKGPEATKQLFTGLQMVVNYWLFHNGFSIGIGDTIADSKTMAYITQTISDRKAQVAQIIDNATQDCLKAAPSMTIRESFESLVERQLNLARDTSGQYAQKRLKEDNNVKQMVVAGLKGSFINTLQMSVCVDDFSPESRGFVENSYLHGLTPQEFFFHTMAGREGLINTAVKTAETGCIQHCLVRALEDVMVCYDGTVRNSLGDLIQFVYGEDSMDGAFTEKQTIETFGLNDREFEHNYRVDVTDLVDSCKEFYRLDRRLLRDFIFPCVPTTQPHYLPLNLQCIVQNAIQIFHIDRRKPSDLEPPYIINSIHELGKHLIVVCSGGDLSVEAQENATLTFRMHLRATFAARHVLEKFHLTREVFDWVVGEVETKFNRSVLRPGEMCGTLGAQSIGEPATQITLNTFHYAGVSSKNITPGVPHLKETINVATNIKTHSLSVYLNPEISASSKLAKDVQQELAYLAATIIPDDSIFVHAFFEIPDEEMIDHKLSMQHIAGRISKSFKTNLFIIWSEENSEKPIIHCRVIGADKGNGDDGAVEDIFLRQLEGAMLNSVSLCGVKGINCVFLTEQDKITVSTEGGIQIGKEKEWVLETDGINLKMVMCIDSVDFRRTYSNSCVEIFNVLGIEAARATILKEFRGIIKFDGSYINYRHLALLCDLMTHRGSLMAITHHSINRANTGTLMRCSFEETVEILMEAAAVGEKDDCHGIVENVMFGQMAPMGTGAFKVALDIDMLKDAIVDHRLPMLASQLDGGMTPGQVVMTPYNLNSPMWQDGMFKGDAASAAFSPLT
ncbi:hypothetical protein D9619_002094 [Psilocybe cf. subviscida]|uniref:DNA-directed RNA polymerase n=1 Tax=Psilocybe cf. subviscida TaxID=2480587 RepID=A0A8H5BH30_9AGAR|nr:hypothetical protein D9619_002094 [Psilocybe cf. subviscida]